jgi:hypothetical protein
MTFFVVIERDLALGDKTNEVLAVCKTIEIAKRVKKETEAVRSEDEPIDEGIFIEIQEVVYIEQ